MTAIAPVDVRSATTSPTLERADKAGVGEAVDSTADVLIGGFVGGLVGGAVGMGAGALTTGSLGASVGLLLGVPTGIAAGVTRALRDPVSREQDEAQDISAQWFKPALVGGVALGLVGGVVAGARGATGLKEAVTSAAMLGGLGAIAGGITGAVGGPAAGWLVDLTERTEGGGIVV